MFNALGFRFQEGVRHIQLAYFQSKVALEQELESTIDRALTHQQQIEQGLIEWIGELDETGRPVWSQEQFNNAAVDDTQGAIDALIKGFVPVIYHHWERSALKWITLLQAYDARKRPRCHDDLVGMVEMLGIKIHPELEIVHTLNNALKHNTPKFGTVLLECGAGVISDAYDPANLSHDLYEFIYIDSHQMQHFFQVVGQSGPDERTVFDYC